MSTDKASVNKDTVKKIGRLARLHIPEEQQEKIADELNTILNWIEELNEVDTTGVKPLSSVTGHELPQREDVVSDGNKVCLLYTSPSPRDISGSRMPSSA